MSADVDQLQRNWSLLRPHVNTRGIHAKYHSKSCYYLYKYFVYWKLQRALQKLSFFVLSGQIQGNILYVIKRDSFNAKMAASGVLGTRCAENWGTLCETT